MLIVGDLGVGAAGEPGLEVEFHEETLSYDSRIVSTYVLWYVAFMDESEIPVEFLRIGLSSEAVKQSKYERWAKEMAEHGWDVRQPTPRKVRALAVQDAMKRVEKARADAEMEAAR